MVWSMQNDCVCFFFTHAHYHRPVFEQLSKENPNVQFVKVDVDAAEDVAEHLNVQAMPTFFV